MTTTLSSEQKAALRRFRETHGRTWKDTLRSMWSSGKDVTQPEGGLLRQIRNNYGPSRLEKLKEKDLED